MTQRTLADDAQMVPMLPCADIDEIAEFWSALGLRVTYRQLRPNPFLALGLGGIDLQYYAMPGHDPEESHSTCGIVVSDTEPLHELFTEGFRASHGRVPQRGAPRMTRPRRRGNNAGLSGFSVIDPAGNWVRVSRRPAAGNEPRAVDDRIQWASSGGGPLARALENAVVQGDSHGDPGQAAKVLSGALARHRDAVAGERVAAWAYLAELCVRLDDADGARAAAAQVAVLAGSEGLTEDEREHVARAQREVGELGIRAEHNGPGPAAEG